MDSQPEPKVTQRIFDRAAGRTAVSGNRPGLMADGLDDTLSDEAGNPGTPLQNFATDAGDHMAVCFLRLLWLV